MLPSGIAGDSLRTLLAFAALFLSVLLAMALITMLISALGKNRGTGVCRQIFWLIVRFYTWLSGSVISCIGSGVDCVAARAILAESLAEQAAGNSGDDGNAMVAAGCIQAHQLCKIKS